MAASSPALQAWSSEVTSWVGGTDIQVSDCFGLARVSAEVITPIRKFHPVTLSRYSPAHCSFRTWLSLYRIEGQVRGAPKSGSTGSSTMKTYGKRMSGVAALALIVIAANTSP